MQSLAPEEFKLRLARIQEKMAASTRPGGGHVLRDAAADDDAVLRTQDSRCPPPSRASRAQDAIGAARGAADKAF